MDILSAMVIVKTTVLCDITQPLQIELDYKYWNYSVTTSKYRNQFLNESTQEASGRPVDILWLKDGSMLISDDYGDAIYRVSFDDTALTSN